MIRKNSSQRPYWKKILFFAALFLFLVGIVVGVSRASAIAAGDSNSGTLVEKAAPVASSGVTGKNPKTSDATVQIVSKDNGSSGETGNQSNDNTGSGSEPGTQQPLVNLGSVTNAKFPQTGEAQDKGQILIGVLLVLLTSIGFAFSIRRRTES